MGWTRTLRLRLRSLFRSTRVERELDEELQYHLARLEDEFVARGLSRGEARYAASREMGAIEPRKEECRDARGVALAEGVLRDTSFALRTLRKSPAFTAVAILSLALGIGANTAIFTLWNRVLHAPLPVVRDPGQLVILSNPDEGGSWTGRLTGPRAWLSYGEFEDLRDRATSFSALMASQSSLNRMQVRVDGGEWESASGRLVSGGFFEVLGVGPAIGRLFTPVEDRAVTPAVVISHAYWQRRFGGRPDALGRSLTVRDAVLTIVGVAPPGFIGETTGQQPDLWMPLGMQPGVLPGRDRLHDTPPEKTMWLHVFGRLKPGVTIAQADAESNAIFMAGLESFYGARATGDRRREYLDQRLELRPAAGGAGPVRELFARPLTALLAGVGVLLLIACANLANLLLARGAARATEIALRLSLGASRGRVIRQLVTESLVLAAAGGVAALAVAAVFHGVLVGMMTKAASSFRMSFSVDPVVLVFALAATLATAVVFGLLPAWQVTRTDAGATLREQSRGATGTPGPLRSGRLLVSLQLALALPLLIGAGLLARTVYNLQRTDLGFPAEHLQLVRVNLGEAGYEAERLDIVLRELLDQIQRIPGVRAVSYSSLGLFTGGESAASIAVDGHTAATDDERESALDVVGPGYFSMLGIPIMMGREIVESDRAGGPAACVVNEAFTRKFLAGRNPIGTRITALEETDLSCQVVGVARDAHTQDLRGDIAPRYFLAARQVLTSASMPIFLVRTADAVPVVADVRLAVQRVNPALPIMWAESIQDQMAPLTAQDRTTAQLAAMFGLVALTLAAIGVYGLLSYGVARRTGEIAVRIAVGARPGRVIAMILRETIGLVGAGLAIGSGLAYAALRLIDSQLYGVTSEDPLTLALATALLLVVALGAAYWPARRASKLDPMAALR